MMVAVGQAAGLAYLLLSTTVVPTCMIMPAVLPGTAACLLNTYYVTDFKGEKL
jgi:hypothetical protein